MPFHPLPSIHDDRLRLRSDREIRRLQVWIDDAHGLNCIGTKGDACTNLGELGGGFVEMSLDDRRTSMVKEAKERGEAAYTATYESDTQRLLIIGGHCALCLTPSVGVVVMTLGTVLGLATLSK